MAFFEEEEEEEPKTFLDRLFLRVYLFSSDLIHTVQNTRCAFYEY